MNWYVDCAAGQNVISNAHKVNWPDTRKSINHSAFNCTKYRASENRFISCELSVSFVRRCSVCVSSDFVGGFWTMAPSDYMMRPKCIHVTEVRASKKERFFRAIRLWHFYGLQIENEMQIRVRFKRLYMPAASNYTSNSKYAWECAFMCAFPMFVYIQRSIYCLLSAEFIRIWLKFFVDALDFFYFFFKYRNINTFTALNGILKCGEHTDIIFHMISTFNYQFLIDFLWNIEHKHR